MKVGDLVKYIASHLEDEEDEEDELGIVVGCSEDGWYWEVYWIKELSRHHFTRASLKVISEV